MRVVKRIRVNGSQVTKLMPKGRVYNNLNKKTKKNGKIRIKIDTFRIKKPRLQTEAHPL